jgi:hypothetical protein
MNPQVDDCMYCTHQRIQHADKDGVCMVGMMLGNLCHCIGLSSVEEERER